MFRQMRRKKQQLLQEESLAVLREGTSGVLAVLGDDDYPYAVPLSYVFHEGKIYFHCAKEGHKLDSIIRNGKVSFCVIGQDHVMPEKYTTYYKSVIAFGKAHIIMDEATKRQTLEALARRYATQQESMQQEIDQSIMNVCMIEMTIDHLTGKEAKELKLLQSTEK